MVTFNADDNAKLSFKWSSEGKLKVGLTKCQLLTSNDYFLFRKRVSPSIRTK
jgi:hypothetical protein